MQTNVRRKFLTLLAFTPFIDGEMALPFSRAGVATGLLDEVGKTIDAVVAAKVAEKVGPDVGLLTKAVTVVAGLKGAGALRGMIEKKDETKAKGAEAAPEDGAAL